MKHTGLFSVCLLAVLGWNLLALAIVYAGPFKPPVTLTWTANTEADLAGYKLYRALTACARSPTFTLLGEVGVMLKPTYVDSTIPAGTRHVCYVVSAFDASNNESVKSDAVGKSVQAAPSAPTPFIIK